MVEIINEFCERLNIDEDYLHSNARFFKIVESRFMLWKLLRMNGYQCKEIAEHVRRSTSSVSSGTRKITGQINKKDEGVLERWNKIKDITE